MLYCGLDAVGSKRGRSWVLYLEESTVNRSRRFNINSLRINVMTCFTRHRLTLLAPLFGWCGFCRRERRMLRTRWACTLLAGVVTGAWILASTSDAATWD